MAKILFSPSILVIWCTKPLSSAFLRISITSSRVDVAPALAGLHHVVGHIAHRDAPICRIVAARLAQHRAAHAAAARACRVLAVVFVEPVADMLDRNAPILGLNGLLDGDDVHADARTARRHHRVMRESGPFDACSKNFAVAGCSIICSQRMLRNSAEPGTKMGANPLLGARGVLPVVLQKADLAHLVEKRLKHLRRKPRRPPYLLEGVGTADLELQEDIGHLVGRDALERPVLVGQKVALAERAVGEMTAERDDLLARVLGQRRHKLRADVGLGKGDAGAVQNHARSFRERGRMRERGRYRPQRDRRAREPARPMRLNTGARSRIALPGCHAPAEPGRPPVDALACLRADGDDLGLGVTRRDVCTHAVHVERVEDGQGIDLG